MESVWELRNCVPQPSLLQEIAAPLSQDSDCGNCRSEEAAILFGELHELLLGNDFIPPEMIDGIKERIKCQAIHKDLDTLAKHIDHYDYPKALAIFEKINCADGRRLGISK